MRRALLAVSLVISLVVLLVACAPAGWPGDRGMEVDVSELGRPGTVAVTARDVAVTGIAVYFHGSDQTAMVVRESEKHRELFAPILQAGYAVVAADAVGNAFGNPASQSDYRRLIAAAKQRFQVDRLYFVAESMGSLAALALLREDTRGDVEGLVGISPLAGMPPQVREQSYIKGPWGGEVPDDADPMSWPVTDFQGRRFLFYVPEHDTVIPAAADGRAFASRFGSVASIEVQSCSGDHVDPTCYQGDTTEQWMATAPN